MKKRAKFFAILLALITVASTISAFAFGKFDSEVATYDEYGYYAYFDFEEYDHTDHFAYFRSNAKNANGLSCDPFDFLLNQQGETHGTGSIEKDGDNTYYHFVQGGSGGAYPVLAVFGMVDENGNDAASESVKIFLLAFLSISASRLITGSVDKKHCSCL